MTIAGKNVLLTGGSAGIGLALAGELLAREAKVLVVSRSRPALNGCLYLACDLADVSAREGVVAEAGRLLGPVDVLVHCAGIGLYASSWKADPADVRRMFEVNLMSAIDLARAVVPSMLERRSGLIVNVSSVAGKVPLPWFSLYSATKAALGSFTEGLRMELDGTGVGTMLVCPGYVKTGFQDHVLGGRPPKKIREAKAFAITPEQCALDIVRGLEKGARTVMTPRSSWGLVAAQGLVPGLVHGRLAKYNREL